MLLFERTEHVNPLFSARNTDGEHQKLFPRTFMTERNVRATRRYNRYANASGNIRETFKNYFVSPVDDVPFQNNN